MKKTRYIPYGYTMRNGRTVISGEEAEVIREIFKSYLNGASLKAIADELTDHQIPYTQKSAIWDKARIARIIDNAKYAGTEEYDPIIDEEMYEAAVNLKIARQCNACEKENDAIDLLREFVRCDSCGHPMKRRINAKHHIRESWNCTNGECGIRVRISDTQLIETITVLINRVILNDHLLQPKPKKRYEPDAKVTKVGNDIALELERDAPNEEFIIEKTIEMAALMYEQSNAKLNLTVSLARKLAQTMVTQDEFNRDYFTALASYITLGEQGKVVLHTKTETEVTLDDGSNESPKKIVTVLEPKRSSSVVQKKITGRRRLPAYCRVSTDSEEQLVSYANQKKVYTEMIASRKDWCFAGLFADEGKSGTRADKRPEFNKMINDCLAGKIDYIITKSVSRFARNTVDCLDYVRMLKSKGIGVYFEEQQIDTLKTDSELYLVIYAGFAQSESESISKNINLERSQEVRGRNTSVHIQAVPWL